MKKSFAFFFLIFLTNCTISGSAFLGPTLTGIKTGNIYQTSLSYGSSKIIENINIKAKEMKKLRDEQLKSIKKSTIDLKKLIVQKIDIIEVSKIIDEEPLP
tara:strand:- start:1632 stop:1934 length:303 start_codon:yes stop_codon:yes gene_type:complete